MQRRPAVVGVGLSAPPVLPTEQQSWVGTREKTDVHFVPIIVADVERSPSDTSRARACHGKHPCKARDRTERMVSQADWICATSKGKGLCRWGTHGKRVYCYASGTACAFDFLTNEYRGSLPESLYRRKRIPEERRSPTACQRTMPSSDDRKLQLYFHGYVWRYPEQTFENSVRETSSTALGKGI